MDAVSNALGGNLPGGAASNAAMQFYKGENFDRPDQSLAGAQAPGDLRPIDRGAEIEFIHIAHVHIDNSKNFHHLPEKDDEVLVGFLPGQKKRAIQYRAALHREAMLLASMMTGCQSVLDALEKTKGGLGQMVDMASDMLGSGGGSQAPKASDINPMGQAVTTAIGKVNTASLTYKDMHQCGIDLHQARCNYRAFQQKLLAPPTNDPTSGLLSKIPVVGPALPPIIGDILNFVTGFAFKPMDVYLHFYVRIAIELEKPIEKAVRSYTVAAIQGTLTPAFYLWYPPPAAPPAPSGGSGGGPSPTGIGFLDDARQRVQDVRDRIQDVRDQVRDFLVPDPDQPDAPGQPYLEQAFQIVPEPPPAMGAPPPPGGPKPPKELATLIANGFKAGLGVGSLPGFVETIIVEVTTVNNEFLRELYKQLMARPAVAEIIDDEVYEAARKRMLDRLVEIVMSKIDFLRQVKDFGVNVQGMNVQPGQALMDKGLEELNSEVLRRLNVALELTMGECVDKLEGLRQQCENANALAYEAYLGVFPWILSLNFRNTFMPVWQLIMDNTLGRIDGPVGDAVRQARNAMNDIKSRVDDARNVATRLQKIKDRATNEGLQLGTGGQNLTGYRDDWNSNAAATGAPPKPPTIPFFPFMARLNQSDGVEITKSQFDAVKPNHKWEQGGDPASY
ncbi:MAG: hypothetical protein FJW30_10890 [Acidobacteria bacterium]|nr:hypothetical protein [Acidobacteriota bacterium]